MRKLVLILLAFFAVVTFIRAFDLSAEVYSDGTHTNEVPGISIEDSGR